MNWSSLFAARNAAALFALAVPALLAQAPPVNFQSTEIHPDHTITFRYKDPGAKKITLVIRDLTKPIPMEKGTDGIWTATTQPLPPAIYNYYFDAEGQWRARPGQPQHRCQVPERHQPALRARRRPPTLGPAERASWRGPPPLLRLEGRP